MIMNDAATVVKGLRQNRDISITSVLKDLHWLPMSERSKFKLISLHKCVYGMASKYMSAMIVKLLEFYASLCSSYDNLKLVEPRVKTSLLTVALVQWAQNYGTICLLVFEMNLVLKPSSGLSKHTFLKMFINVQIIYF